MIICCNIFAFAYNIIEKIQVVDIYFIIYTQRLIQIFKKVFHLCIRGRMIHLDKLILLSVINIILFLIDRKHKCVQLIIMFLIGNVRPIIRIMVELFYILRNFCCIASIFGSNKIHEAAASIPNEFQPLLIHYSIQQTQ